jgi:hypothetical protein
MDGIEGRDSFIMSACEEALVLEMQLHPRRVWIQGYHIPSRSDIGRRADSGIDTILTSLSNRVGLQKPRCTTLAIDYILSNGAMPNDDGEE